MKVKMI